MDERDKLLGMVPHIVTVAAMLAIAPNSARAVERTPTFLNNDGVMAMKAGNQNLAIKKFEEALASDPKFEVARQNLGVAHNNIALSLGQRCEHAKALKQFHHALIVDAQNKTTKGNLEIYLRSRGYDPSEAKDRSRAAQDCERRSDWAGAVVEYRAAAEIESSPGTTAKLQRALTRLKRHEKTLYALDVTH